MNESWPAPAVPQVVVLEDLDQDPSIPTDDTALFTVLLPLAIVLVMFLAALVSVVIEEPRLLLQGGLGLGGSEEGVERLAEADGKTNERHQRHVQRAGFNLLEVLPVHIAPLGGLFERPVGRMAESPNASPERPLLLLEARRLSVCSRGSFGLG